MQPNPAVLQAMFGDDSPIGSYAEESFRKDISAAQTLDNYVNAACDYGISAHDEEYNYSQISPYGGEDITIGDSDSHAIGATYQIHKGLAEAGVELSLEDFEDAVYAELLSRGVEPKRVTKFISRYESMKSLPEYAKREFEIYNKEQTDFNRKIQEKVNQAYAEGSAEYQACKNQINQLKSHRIKNLLFPKQYNEQLMDLEDRMTDASIKMDLTADSYLDANPEIYPPYISYCEAHAHGWEALGFSFPDSLENIEKIKVGSATYIDNPENKKQYERFQKIVATQKGKEHTKDSPTKKQSHK